MPTVNRVSGTPLSVSYREPTQLSRMLNVTVKVQNVKREKAHYNHIKKTLKVSDLVKVPNVCKDVCVTSPVVLELHWSAPEGVSSADYKKILDKAVAQLGGEAGIFIPEVASLEY